MKQIETVRELDMELAAKRDGKIGFVPTMGALHEGHLSLVRRAAAENDTVVVSIFVNPTQFNDPEDLRRYPRTLDTDMELLRGTGADYVFTPSVEEIYPEPDTRTFDFGVLDKVMEGATRPGHFNGVAQVVSRLFGMVKPHSAYFGQKDFQQLAVIRELVRQERSDIRIVECPIVREEDGLAMSSRNALLTPECRKAAPQIYRALSMARELKGTMSVAALEKQVTDEINKDPLLKVVYFRIVDRDTLTEASDWSDGRGKQGCVAVMAGNVRLIDNVYLG